MKCPPGPLLDEKIKLQGIEKLQEEKSTRLLSTALDIYTKKLVLLSIQTLETLSHVLLIEQKVAQNSCPTLPFWMAYDLEKYED